MRTFFRRDQIGRALSGVLAVGALAAATTGCVEQDDESPTEEDMKTIKASLLAAPPAAKFPVNADLDGKLVYLGLDADPPVAEPGKDVKLTHYWKVVTPPGDGWRLFTHLEGPNHQNYINADHVPIGGKYAVGQWKPGEIIRDEHVARLPPTWAHASVSIYVGGWRGATRMAVRSGPNDGANRVLAATIPVKAAAARAVEPPRKRYVARKTAKPIKIDGKLDDAAWQAAPWTEPFADTMTGAPVDFRTEAKLAWDDKFLYVAFQNADTDIWSSLGKRDDKLWTQEAVELMIDADANGRSYIELQVAPNGAVFDTYLPEYRKYEDTVDPKRKQFSWNSKVNAKVSVDGTLNKRGDQDKSWTVEMAIPLEDVKGLDAKAELPKLPPPLGSAWRISMFRMDMPEGKGQKAAGWAPPLVGDFHALGKFGDLVFGDDQGNVMPPPPPMPPMPAMGTGGAGGKKMKGRAKDRVLTPAAAPK